MRPTRRMLALAAAALAVSFLVLAAGQVAAEASLFIWVGLAAVFLLDLVTSPTSRDWSIYISGPNEIFTGERGTLQIIINFNDRRPPGEIRARLAYPEGIRGPEELLFHISEDGRRAGVRAELDALRRGAWTIDEGWLSWRSRFGLRRRDSRRHRCPDPGAHGPGDQHRLARRVVATPADHLRDPPDRNGAPARMTAVVTR